MGHINFTEAKNGKSSAVCCCCGRKSRPVTVCSDGEPDLCFLSRGWSEAPYPHDLVHRDGSYGSMFTCPACNKRLAAGKVLTLRSERGAA